MPPSRRTWLLMTIVVPLVVRHGQGHVGLAGPGVGGGVVLEHVVVLVVPGGDVAVVALVPVLAAEDVGLPVHDGVAGVVVGDRHGGARLPRRGGVGEIEGPVGRGGGRAVGLVAGDVVQPAPRMNADPP
jgi:hypothetical protein